MTNYKEKILSLLLTYYFIVSFYMGHKTKRIEWGRGEKRQKSLMFKWLCVIR